jgi:hypothetical protein
MLRKIVGLGLSVAALAVAAGCHILDVSNPDIILPGNLNSAAALPTVRSGVIGDFAFAYSGSGAQGSGGTTEGQILISGMLGDELINTETFPDRVFADARRSQIESGTLGVIFRNLHRARRSAEIAAVRFRQYSDTTTNSGLSEMLSLAGFTYVFFAENYCSGVPFSQVKDDGSFQYGGPLTTVQMLDTALNRFQQALAAANVLPAGATKTSMLSLASVGIGRVLLDQGKFGLADSAVSVSFLVPTSFNYTVQHDLNTTRQQNGVYSGIRKFKRYGVADAEGVVGIPWRSQPDPRTPFFRSPGTNFGFDGFTPQYDQLRYLDEKAFVTVATGTEARLITAEAQLKRNDITGMTATLNALRATPPTYFLANGAALAPMAALATPGSTPAAVTLLFSERAHWLWLTSHRLSDLRRLERQYSLPDNQVFPTGAYFKNGLSYGTDVNLPVPFDEENNPSFTACLDRLP